MLGTNVDQGQAHEIWPTQVSHCTFMMMIVITIIIILQASFFRAKRDWIGFAIRSSFHPIFSRAFRYLSLLFPSTHVIFDLLVMMLSWCSCYYNKLSSIHPLRQPSFIVHGWSVGPGWSRRVGTTWSPLSCIADSEHFVLSQRGGCAASPRLCMTMCMGPLSHRHECKA